MKNSLVKYKNRNSSKYIVIISFIVVLLFFIFLLIWSNYKNFRDSIIYNEQQNLLLISEMTARSLETYIDEQRVNIEVIAKNHEFQEKFNALIKSKNSSLNTDIMEIYYKTQGESVQSIELLNKNGVIMSKQPNIIEDKEIVGKNISNYIGVKEVIKEHTIAVGTIQFEKNIGPTICLLQPVFYNDEFQGIIRSKLSINTIYKKIVQPIKVGNKGYASVKDKNGVLLMHPNGEDIGKNVMEARQGEFPGFDWSELSKIVEEQMTGGKGVNIYYSIWPGDESNSRIKKISAYSPAFIGDDFWTVTVTMDYQDIVTIINKNLYNTLVLAGLIILIFILVIR